MAWAVILNPLHPNLPKLPILINPTCNAFDANFVCQQWETKQSFYDKHLHDVLGPLTGRASDGNAWRRALMVDTAMEITIKYQSKVVSSTHATKLNKTEQPDG